MSWFYNNSLGIISLETIILFYLYGVSKGYYNSGMGNPNDPNANVHVVGYLIGLLIFFGLFGVILPAGIGAEVGSIVFFAVILSPAYSKAVGGSIASINTGIKNVFQWGG
jgi:hypothetical protein